MLFVDTAAFIARHLADDKHHGSAEAFWRRLAGKEASCFTSNFVIDETLTLLGRKVNNAFAAQRGKNILASQALTILRPNQDDEKTALELFGKYSDQRVSYTDCISFALMRRYKIRRVFTFDHHFSVAGFDVVP